MPNLFFIADLHLGHHNIYTWRTDDGKPYRPWSNPEEAEEIMIDNYNRVVGKNDTVWFLGDIAMKRTSLSKLSRLQGTKKLVLGNHDQYSMAEYGEYFSQIAGFKYLNKHRMVLSHAPVHPYSISPSRFDLCIHGHLHRDTVRLPNGCPDPRYFCVSLEQINYTPISLEEIKSKCGL